MEEIKEHQKIDLLVVLDDFLREAKRLWMLAVVFVLVCAIGMACYRGMNYYPRYEATASFTVKVANPLYASVSSYNSATAEQMEKTFPYILTSGVLQERVREHLGISYMPSVSVSVTPGTSILTLVVRDSDPQRAYDVLNAVITYYPEVAEFVVGSTVMVLLDESGVPTHPANAFSFTESLKTGVLVGAALWIALVVLMALAKSTIHNEEELKRLLNCACLGQLPDVKVQGKGVCPLILKGKKKPGFSEAVRLLRLRVEKQMLEKGKKVLLISSAIPGEGKTTVSTNLAISLAKKGHRVLLIDCDMRNPSVAKALQMNCRNSLVEYLNAKSTVKDTINSTEVENLFVISGGTGAKANYSEYLSQERAARLIQASKNLFDFIILDTPPCSLLADAAEVAELAECGLMVIRQDFASRDQIVDGIQRLSDGNLEMLGCVFNGVRKSLSSGCDYGYGYGYGYGNKPK